MEVKNHQCLRPMADVEDIAVRFMPDDPHAYPQPGELVARTFEWLQSMEPQMSAEWYPLEVSAESGREEPKRTPRPKQQAAFPGGATPTGGGSKAKKPTAASLAVSMQQVGGGCIASSVESDPDDFRQAVRDGGEAGKESKRGCAVKTFGPEPSNRVPEPGSFNGQRASFSSKDNYEIFNVDTHQRFGSGACGGASEGQRVDLGAQGCDPGHSGPECCPHGIGGSTFGRSGSNARVSRSIGWNKRSSRKGSASVGVGTPSWHVFPVDGAQHGKTYVPNLESRDPSWSTPCQWNIRYEVPRKIRRVWKAKRVGFDSIPTHDHGGLRYVGELGSCKGHVGPPGGDDRTSLPRSRQVRLSSAFDSSRGSAIRSFHKPSTFTGEPCKGFLTSGRSAMGHGGISVLEGTRYNLDKEERVVASFSSWRRTAFPTFAEEPWSTWRKRKRQRPWKEAAAVLLEPWI